MNYYNYPFFGIPHLNYPKTSLFTSLFKNKINWSALLNNTQRTLNLINQTVPIIKQVPPIYRNAKTMFKVLNEFKKVDDKKPTPNPSSVKTEKAEPEKEKIKPHIQNSPTFFL